MKKVLFCIVCLNMALLCFGQPVKIKLVAEREAFVLFGDERYDLKKGETRWITLEVRICMEKGYGLTRSVSYFLRPGIHWKSFYMKTTSWN